MPASPPHVPSPRPVPLTYANPRETRPIGCAFTAVWHDDGVTLTRPVPVRPFLRMGLGFLIMFSIALLGVAAVQLVTPHSNVRSELHGIPRFLLLPVLAIAGAARYWPMTRPHEYAVSMRDGRLAVTNDPRALVRRNWSSLGTHNFYASLGQPDVLRMRVIANLRYSNRFSIGRTLLVGEDKAVAEWVARQLNAATQRETPAASPVAAAPRVSNREAASGNTQTPP